MVRRTGCRGIATGEVGLGLKSSKVMSLEQYPWNIVERGSRTWGTSILILASLTSARWATPKFSPANTANSPTAIRTFVASSSAPSTLARTLARTNQRSIAAKTIPLEIASRSSSVLKAVTTKDWQSFAPQAKPHQK